MGLIGGMARTAVVAGTATAVSNRVSRRQAGRWAAQEQQQYAQQQYAQQQYAQQQYAQQQQAQQQYAQQQQYSPPAQADERSSDDLIARLHQLGELRDQGILTEEEFEGQKAKLLAQ